MPASCLCAPQEGRQPAACSAGRAEPKPEWELTRHPSTAPAQGKGSYGLLSAAWEEMRNTVRSWLEGRSKPPTQSAAQLQASAARAVRAMHAALAAPGGEAGADAVLVQVPLESIVGGDSGAALQAVQQAIELEQRVVGARLAAAQGQAPSPSQAEPSEGGDPQQQQQQPGEGKQPSGSEGQPLVGYFSSVAAGWCDSFDSGAPSDPMEQVGAWSGGGAGHACAACGRAARVRRAQRQPRHSSRPQHPPHPLSSNPVRCCRAPRTQIWTAITTDWGHGQLQNTAASGAAGQGRPVSPAQPPPLNAITLRPLTLTAPPTLFSGMPPCDPPVDRHSFCLCI